ncbi:MAG TPA: DMT family transporter [Patescibacteria group bacterium]|nr:DMT family transporter [Patescibacteria group bacterium]
MPRLGQVEPDRRPALGAGLSLVLAAACWGIGTVVSKQAVAEVAPLTLLPIQLASSVLLLLVITRWRHEPLPSGREGRLLGRLGLLNPGLAYALSLLGLTGITASLAVLLWAGEPILILLLAAAVLGDRIGPAIVLPSIAAIGGLTVVVLDPAASGSMVGVGLTVAGVVVCAAYTVLTRRWLLGTDATFGVVLAQQLYALVLSAIVLIGLMAAGQPMLPVRVTAVGALSAVVSGLLYYAFAYSFYISALRRVRASIAAASFYLIPVFGLAGAWVTGERLQPVQWLGAAIVIGAVAWITVRADQAPAASDRGGQPSSAAAPARIPIKPQGEIRSPIAPRSRG